MSVHVLQALGLWETPTGPLKGTRKRRIKPKVNRRNKILKIRVMINEKETKKTIEQINKTKSLFFAKIWQNWLDLLRKKKKRMLT